jgi:hypothetical protein
MKYLAINVFDFLLGSVSKTSVSMKTFWILKTLANPKTTEQSSLYISKYRNKNENLKFLT